MTEIEKMWIPMSERKPTWDDFPDETECYVLSDRWDSKHGFVPRVYFAIWTGEHFILERTFGVPMDRVTHWMPPPKAPTQEQMLLGEETWNPAKAAPTMNGVQWIPVSERLPERFKNVLCWYEYRNGAGKMVQTYGIGFYFKDDTWGGEVSNGYDTKVIAWMPLPEPPKEET